MYNSLLVIPLCGYGKRFKKVGYKKHKSILKIDNAHMIERVIGKFNDKTIVYLITTLNIKKELEDDHFLKKRISKNTLKIIIIDDHVLGPAYTIFKAYDDLPKGIPTFISYCDITWSWNNNKFLIPKEEVKAAIFCHYGFHPHLVNNNYSAFCLESKDSKNELLEIKEKESFTNDWMNEPLSIGLFYVKDLILIGLPLKKLITSNNKVSNEFFPSLMFNEIIKSKIGVKLIPVKNFIHYGTPEQYEDFISWINFLKYTIKNLNFQKLYSTFIFTSGKGSRMKDISDKPKALITINKERLLELVLKYMPIDSNKISLVFNNLEVPLSFLNKKVSYIKIKETNSQIESLFESKYSLEKLKNFFICSCDCFGFFDQELFYEKVNSSNYDIICFGFNPSLLQIKSKSNYSTLEHDKGEVKKLFIKKVDIKSSKGLAGFFWIKNGKNFSQTIDNFYKSNIDINREIIIDDLMEYSLDIGKSLGFVPLEKYYHLGTPDELREYQYWLNNYKSLIEVN